ncbi:hypothetical protein ACG04R_14840 [Roseateles sp. BYS78W]|uniref:Restriction endonuclease type IV Mrr domain-containing protein n=1 Tax=Pelomonas candidula TaxID=3299025 RepID=A0ABW7HDH4_9BURK
MIRDDGYPEFLANQGGPFDHPKVRQLLKVLAGYSLEKTLTLAAGLCTVPRFQANTYRLELFVQAVVAGCRGKKTPTWQQLQTWLNFFVGDFEIVRLEDPPEDAFVLNVLTSVGDFRVLGGTWEAGEHAASLLIEAVGGLKLKNPGRFMATILALLRMSDAVAARAGLPRWHAEQSVSKRALSIGAKTPLTEWAKRVVFTVPELVELGIEPEHLSPLVLSPEAYSSLADQSNQESDLHRYPVLRVADSFILALPSAVTYTVRRFIVSVADELDLVGDLNSAMMNRVLSRLQEALRNSHRHPVANLDLPASVRSIGGWCVSIVIRVGQRRFLHFVVVAFGLQDIADSGYLHPRELSDSRSRQLLEHMDVVRKHLEDTQEVDSGHTFLMGGHLGEGVLWEVPQPRDRWTFSVARLADLEMLFRDQDDPSERLILMLNQQEALERQGVEMLFDNGLLNRYAFWLKQDFVTRIPEMRHDQGGMLQIATDYVTSYRVRRRRSVDEHCERLPMGKSTVVQRASSESVYWVKRDLDCYVSMDLLEEGVLAFCAPHRGSLVWVAMESNRGQRMDRAVFDLWEGLQLFVSRALELLVDDLTFVAPVVGVHIDFSAVLLRAAPEAEKSTKKALRTYIQAGGWTAQIEAEPGFLQNFDSVENRGEQYLLAEVIRALALVSHDLPRGRQLDCEALALRVLGGTGARILHVLRPSTQVEALLASDRRRIYRSPTEHLESRLREAFTWMQAPAKPVMLDAAASKERLNKAVEVKALALIARLRKFDRVAIIEELLRCNETLLKDAQRWKTTARAVRGLYGVDDGTRAARESDASRSQLQITLRALVEAAACEAVDIGGRRPDDFSTDELVGEMAALINLGRDSDVVHYGLSTQGILQFPNGSYELSAEVIAELSEPFHRATFGQGYASAAERYEEWAVYKPAPVDALDGSVFVEKAFVDAWAAEYGLSFESFRQIFGGLMDLGATRSSVVVRARASEIVEARASVGVTEADVAAFLRSFGLPRRSGWLAKAGLDNPKDVNPWRYERRLSVMLRPLIILDEGQGEFMYGVGVCRDALLYVMDSVADAAFDKDVFGSRAMRSWLGGRVAKLGAGFSAEVGALLESHGWKVRLEIKLTELGAPKNPNLGDIDVLAWRPDGRVMQIECKRLKASRTIAEIAQTCGRFRGNVGDHLHKHLRRSEWVRENQAKIAEFTGVDVDKLLVRQPMVVSRPVPFGYLSDLPIPASEIVQVDSLLNYVESWDRGAL